MMVPTPFISPLVLLLLTCPWVLLYNVHDPTSFDDGFEMIWCVFNLQHCAYCQNRWTMVYDFIKLQMQEGLRRSCRPQVYSELPKLVSTTT